MICFAYSRGDGEDRDLSYGALPRYTLERNLMEHRWIRKTMS
jgi:hypothetical protein